MPKNKYAVPNPVRSIINPLMNSTSVTPFSEIDCKTIRKLKNAEYLKLGKVYGIFILAIAVGAEKGMMMNPAKMRVSAIQLVVATWSFVIFFSLILVWFLSRDYARYISPVYKDMKNKQKTCISFTARKYHDFMYGRFLLFHPEKEDVYIAISETEFNETNNGDNLYLEQASISGEILLLKNKERLYNEAEEFSFLEHKK